VIAASIPEAEIVTDIQILDAKPVHKGLRVGPNAALAVGQHVGAVDGGGLGDLCHKVGLHLQEDVAGFVQEGGELLAFEEGDGVGGRVEGAACGLVE